MSSTYSTFTSYSPPTLTHSLPRAPLLTLSVFTLLPSLPLTILLILQSSWSHTLRQQVIGVSLHVATDLGRGQSADVPYVLRTVYQQTAIGGRRRKPPQGLRKDRESKTKGGILTLYWDSMGIRRGFRQVRETLGRVDTGIEPWSPVGRFVYVTYARSVTTALPRKEDFIWLYTKYSSHTLILFTVDCHIVVISQSAVKNSVIPYLNVVLCSVSEDVCREVIVINMRLHSRVLLPFKWTTLSKQLWWETPQNINMGQSQIPKALRDVKVIVYSKIRC